MRLRRTLLAGLCVFGFFACKKNFPEQTEEQKALQADTYAATTILSVEGMLNEIEFIAKQVPMLNQDASFLSCATIAKQDVTGGQKIEVLFNSNAVCNDNTVRAGKLSILYYSNGDISVTPSNYVVGNTKISGSYYFTKVTENQKDYLLLSVSGGKFLANSGAYIMYDVERRSTIKSGGGTSDFTDDVIEIDQGVYDLHLFDLYAGTQVSAEIKTPCTLKYSCSEKFRPRTGTISFQRMGQNKRIIELGSGNCSDVPTLSEVVQ